MLALADLILRLLTTDSDSTPRMDTLPAGRSRESPQPPKDKLLNHVLDLQRDSGAGLRKIEQFQQNPDKHQCDARDQQCQ